MWTKPLPPFVVFICFFVLSLVLQVSHMNGDYSKITGINLLFQPLGFAMVPWFLYSLRYNKRQKEKADKEDKTESN